MKGTNAFVAGLETMASTLRHNPDYALVIESGSVADYESVLSYEQFLRAYGVENHLFLRIHGYSLDTATSDDGRNLTAGLIQTMEGAGAGFAPITDLTNFGPKCFSLDLSGSFTTESQPIN